jgi:hypothetical protein
MAVVWGGKKKKRGNFRLTFILCCPVWIYSARDGIVYLYWRSYVNVAMTTRGTSARPIDFLFHFGTREHKEMLSAK